MKGIEVVPRVYQLPLSRFGPFVLSAFVILEDTITVIDAGTPGNAGRIGDFIRSLGRSPLEVSRILLTHYHFDHIGSLAALKELTSAQVASHKLEAEYVAGEKPFPIPARSRLLRLSLSPMFRLFRVKPAPVEVVMEEGYELDILGGMRVIHTPGHSPGSVSFYFPSKGLIIAGDAAQRWGGKLSPPSRLFSQDMGQAKESLKKLAALNFEIMALSHFLPLRKGAALEVRKLAEALS